MIARKRGGKRQTELRKLSGRRQKRIRRISRQWQRRSNTNIHKSTQQGHRPMFRIRRSTII